MQKETKLHDLCFHNTTTVQLERYPAQKFFHKSIEANLSNSLDTVVQKSFLKFDLISNISCLFRLYFSF